MGRVKLEIPGDLPFATLMRLRVGDLNYGGHLGNDRVLGLFHEARLRFLKHLGWDEADIEGAGLLMTDAVVTYRSQGFHGDRVRIEVGVGAFEGLRFDFFYRLASADSDREMARAKTGMVFFDYRRQKPVPIPAAFRRRATASATDDEGRSDREDRQTETCF